MKPSGRQEWSSSSGPSGQPTPARSGQGAPTHGPVAGPSSLQQQPQEWCLQAQLTISHPQTEPVRTTYVASGIGSGAPKDKWTTTGSNIQFQYSWSNCDKETVTEVIPEPGIQKFESWPRSALATGFSPNFSRSIQPYSRRCISTCTITLSNEGHPASKFSFSSENLSNLHQFSNSTDASASKNNTPPVATRILVKDAETQTSPVKTINQFTSITVNPDTSNVTVLNNARASPQKYHLNEKESFKSVTSAAGVNKGQSESPLKMPDHSSRGSFRSSAVRRAKSSPPIRYQQKTNQPRTVHIDVYCTGSDVSTSTEDNEESSLGTSSTPQTVYNTSQYKIHHHRHKNGLPQHYGEERKNVIEEASRGQETILKSTEVLNNCAREAQAQDQIQRKPVLLQPPEQVFVDKFVTLRKNLSGESCDTTGSLLSTAYPSSVDRLSRVSTASSFSFASGYEQQNETCSSWKESTVSRQSASSGSSIKSAPLGGMERKLDALNQSDLDESLLQGNDMEGSEQWWLQYLFSKFDVKDEDAGNNVTPNVNNTAIREKSSQESNLLNMKRLSFPTFNLHEEEKVLPPFMEHSSGGAHSRLDTATKFGTVVRGFRKPGHHIPGPTKNPNCPCDHCRIHFESRESGVGGSEEKDFVLTGRPRAVSLDQMQIDSKRSQSMEVLTKNNLNAQNARSTPK